MVIESLGSQMYIAHETTQWQWKFCTPFSGIMRQYEPFLLRLYLQYDINVKWRVDHVIALITLMATWNNSITCEVEVWSRHPLEDHTHVLIVLLGNSVAITTLGLYSLSGKMSYRQIWWSLEAARLDVAMVVSL